jgi:hypothetical protein
MTWHADAERWALDAAGTVLPAIRYMPTGNAPAASLAAVVGPATIIESAIAMGGRMDARMSVDVTVASPGDTEPGIAAMTEAVDALCAALIAAGAAELSTSAGVLALPDAPNPRPVRTITAVIATSSTC